MPRMKGSRLSSPPSRKSKKKAGRTTGVLEMEMEPLAGRTNTGNEQEISSTASSGCGSYLGKITFSVVALAMMAGFLVFAVGVETVRETFGVDKLEVGEGILGIDEAEEAEAEKKASKRFHTTGGSFGGINNIAHPGGAKAAARGEGIAFEDIIIPESNVGHAIKSLNRPNIVNALGHYIHDEHRSPYASHFYKATKEELEERQQKYIAKMEKIREDWGAWDFRDPKSGPQKDTTTPNSEDFQRTAADFSTASHKDLPVDEFPPDSWQADDEYVAMFLEEAKKLVHRVREGIYAEVGWPKKDDDDEYMKLREKLFKIHVWSPECDTEDKEKLPAYVDCVKEQPKDRTEGTVVLRKPAFEALVRKLLHAMMTNDEFYAVLAGHSAAAGHGNNFQQNRIITFHHVMEPVFDKLGMRLVSRNMGMGGVGTLHFSLAGGDLYGETDILEWDSAMTEKGDPVDFFNKQAIMSGERVPIIITDIWHDIMEETNQTAFMGKYGHENKAIFPDTTFENCQEQVWAARWMNGKENKYNAICWEPRSDYEPEREQKPHPGSQVGWHPGNRNHQWKGRKLALIVLEALIVAFERWEEGIATSGLPLAASYWHVEDTYKTIRENLRTHVNTPKPGEAENAPLSACERMYPWLPRICRVQMHGFGMWLPRAQDDFDFLNIIHPAPNGYKPYYGEQLYNGFDVLPLNQAIPDGEVDVHAIAIATTSPAPDIDHSFIDEEISTENGDLTSVDGVVNSTDVPPPTRRWLHEASNLGFRKAADTFSPHTIVKERQLLPEEKEKSQVLLHSAEKPMLRRTLENQEVVEANNTETIVPGRGWEVAGWSTVKGFCDGSAQSECKRDMGQECLLSGANDVHVAVWGNTLSGWLVFTVPKVREGIILLRMEWWCGNNGKNHKITQGWTEVNNGNTTDTTPWNKTAHREMMGSFTDITDEDLHRNLGKANRDVLVPKDLEFDYVVNGVKKTMYREEWLTFSHERVKNVAVWPILNDIDMAEKDWDGEPVEVAVRFRSKIEPRATYCISHVYYA
eukprot:CAMPEP_0116134426 /NCGR_PEP_ID=MMETSP0329-20121206/10638_1 /TAXON_ID=697910 /ORGANISM="Pseudo-nitzschia arenysensis, Strain B593" /LENGTH=1029 /DNA_ID=CAMNT_0003629133 /DNA_START=91 /DNA_END=3180 /DNA_ORIENTATION=-